MKRILLLALALLLLQGVCLAEIKKQVDDFDGSYCYYVRDNWNEHYGQTHINTTFNLAFDNKDIGGSPNLILRYLSYRKDVYPPYSIDQIIKIRVDDIIYTIGSDSSSTRANDRVSIVFGLPNELYEAIMKTKNDITIRFNYHSLDGYYSKDYTIPYKTIQEVQTMYKTYYKPPVTQVAK